MPAPFSCPLCKRPAARHFFTVHKLCRHLEISHQHEPHFSITCGINACPVQYTKVTSFRKHLARKHSNVWMLRDPLINDRNIQQQFQEPVAENDDVDINLHIFDSDDENNEESEIANDLCKSMALLSLKLREKHVIPALTTKDVIDTIKSVLVTVVQDSYDDLEINDQLTKEEKCAARVQLITDACNNVCTEFKLQQYCQKSLNMVEPDSFILGRTPEGKKHVMQYISILKTLELVLNNEDIVSHIMQRRKIHDHDPDILCDYSDGNLFKQHSFFSKLSNCVKLRLHFYIDEFEIVNPLGSKRGKHKLTGVYFMIGNIHPKYRSKLENIYLCILVNYKWIQKEIYTYSDVFKHLVTDLHILENEGLQVSFQGSNIHFKGSIATLSADNLSSHDVGGFQKHFHTGRICRVCMIKKEDISLKTSEEDCVLRTKAVHNYHLEAVEQDSSNSMIYGVLGSCALNGVGSFDVTECLPPDVMHDCLEGVFAKTIEIVLKSLISNGELSFQDVNTGIINFKFGQNDTSNKPSAITVSMLRNGISGKASEKWCLFRLLPQIIGHKVSVENEYWKFYLLCREIGDIVFANVFRKTWILHFTNLIAEFIELFKEYSDGFPCKVHYLVHYPRLMQFFGPLKHLWCMRFEAKHQYFKKLANVMCNFRNPALTLAKRHQQKQCWEHNSRLPLGKLNMQGGNELKFNSLPVELQDILTEKCLSNDINLCDKNVFWKFNMIEKDSVKYAVNDCFIVKLLHEEEIPVFAELMFIICTNNICFLCGRSVVPECFNEHLYAYQVKKSTEWFVFFPGQEVDYHALDIYKEFETGVYYIPMRYKVTNL